MKTIFTFLFILFGANLLFSQANTTTEPTISEENQKIKMVENNPNQKIDTNKTVIPAEEVQTNERGATTNQESNQSKFPTPIQEEKKEFIIPKKND